MIDRGNNSDTNNVVYLPKYDRAAPVTAPVPAPQHALPHNPLAATLRLVREEAGAAALLILRIPEYREFIESFGDDCGLQLDRAISRRLQDTMRRSDRTIPLGNGDYGIVIPLSSDRKDMEAVCERLIENCGGDYPLEELTPRVHPAIGVALYPADSNSTTEVQRFANIALRGAHASEGKDYQFFSSELLKRQRHRLWMEAELKHALAEDRFILHYQPQYALDSHEIVGLEALVRMVTADGEMIPPDHFISVAEENGFIVDLGYWVITEACRQLGEWRSAGCAPQRIAVNVSSLQLQDSRLPAVIDKAVADAGIEHRDLELEVTESSMLECLPVTEKVLRRLHARGVRFAIDDFGAGFSSFATLARLHLDTFKLDRSFMTNLSTDARARQVVSAIIAMAGELGYEIIAEGVETDQQYWFLQASGCHLVQGFGLARPQDARAVAELLHRIETVATAD